MALALMGIRMRRLCFCTVGRDVLCRITRRHELTWPSLLAGGADASSVSIAQLFKPTVEKFIGVARPKAIIVLVLIKYDQAKALGVVFHDDR